MNAQAMTRHDPEAGIAHRSWTDETFRREFTASPAVLSDGDLEKVAGGLITTILSGELIVAGIQAFSVAAATSVTASAVVTVNNGW
jgi:hypothetical protein